MSRIGKKPIPVPAGVDVVVDGSVVRVKGPKGGLEREVAGPVAVAFDGAARRLVVTRRGDDKDARAQHGLWRALIANMVEGVVNGYEKTLEIIGVGFRGEVAGPVLKLHVGFAKPAELKIPQGLKVEARKPTRTGIDGEIHVSGIDKELVGQFAANVRRVKPPDLYKGKGIRYRGEYVRKLQGKTFGSVQAG
jgi:large subunit ribosomal protein L6